MSIVKIYLGSSGKYATIDEVDQPLINMYSWHFSSGYAKTKLDGVVTGMHVLVAGIPDYPIQIDHIDKNRLNNVNNNLRLCSKAENGRNRGPNKNNTTGAKGVTRFKSKLQAQITVNRTHIVLGLYDTIKEAADAYDLAALRYFGQFAYLNNYQAPVTND